MLANTRPIFLVINTLVAEQFDSVRCHSKVSLACLLRKVSLDSNICSLVHTSRVGSNGHSVNGVFGDNMACDGNFSSVHGLSESTSFRKQKSHIDRS